MKLSSRLALFALTTLTSISLAQTNLPEKPLQYASDTHVFSEGLAAIQLGTKWGLAERNNPINQDQNISKIIGKWGFIDRTGHLVINIQFDDVNDFNNGLAPVRIGQEWGLINNSGKFIVQPKYNSLSALKNGFIALTNMPDVGLRMGYLDKEGKVTIQPKYEGIKIVGNNLFGVRENNLWGLMNSKGEQLTPCIFDSIETSKSNLIIVGIKSFDTTKYGLINENGKIVNEPVYDKLVSSEDGLLLSQLDHKWGIINNEGRTISTPIYDNVRPFKEGLSAIYQNSKWGFIDTKGNIVVEPIYDFVGNFQDHRAVIGSKKFSGGFNYGYIDEKGNIVVEPIYDNAFTFSEKLAGVCQVGFRGPKCGYIDLAGTTVIDTIYSSVGNFKNGFAPVSITTFFPKQVYTQYISKSGQIIFESKKNVDSFYPKEIKGMIFLNSGLGIGDFNNGFALLIKDGKLGLIDSTGQIIVESQYKSITNFHDGLAKAVSTNGKVVYIDTKGKIVLE